MLGDDDDDGIIIPSSDELGRLLPRAAGEVSDVRRTDVVGRSSPDTPL